MSVFVFSDVYRDYVYWLRISWQDEECQLSILKVLSWIERKTCFTHSEEGKEPRFPVLTDLCTAYTVIKGTPLTNCYLFLLFWDVFVSKRLIVAHLLCAQYSKVVNKTAMYVLQENLFQAFYFKISCFNQCVNCHFFVCICEIYWPFPIENGFKAIFWCRFRLLDCSNLGAVYMTPISTKNF